jgi:hypothetical protein
VADQNFKKRKGGRARKVDPSLKWQKQKSAILPLNSQILSVVNFGQKGWWGGVVSNCETVAPPSKK